jgi:hypothetical protein
MVKGLNMEEKRKRMSFSTSPNPSFSSKKSRKYAAQRKVITWKTMQIPLFLISTSYLNKIIIACNRWVENILA